MRYFCLLLISFLVLSNAVNAADICCAAMEQSQTTSAQKDQSNDMPCHEVENHNSMSQDDNMSHSSNMHSQADSKADHDCECQGCVQLNHIIGNSPQPSAITTASLFYYAPQFQSTDPDTIYYPPKPLA